MCIVDIWNIILQSLVEIVQLLAKSQEVKVAYYWWDYSTLKRKHNLEETFLSSNILKCSFFEISPTVDLDLGLEIYHKW